MGGEVWAAMKLLHFADLHLDAAFAWLGDARVARARRDALRNALQRIVTLAHTERVDAVLCAGDLYEHDRISPDTAAFLRGAFADLHPIRVFVAPGNHDYYAADSLYRRASWSGNVHIFTEPRLVPVPLAEGLTLWGAAHLKPAGTPGFLQDFSVDRDGTHLALFDGSEHSTLRDQGDGKVAHAPFAADDVRRAGFDHAFVGHYHVARMAAHHTYPGNPDPLSFGEVGPRGAVLVRVRPDGGIEREQRPVAVSSVHDIEIDVTGCATRNEVAARVAATVTGRTGLARITLRGELAPDVDFAPHDLDPVTAHLDAAVVRASGVRVAYDFDTIAIEPTVRGQFVRDVRESALETEQQRRVLDAGLRALAGRDDLEVF